MGLCGAASRGLYRSAAPERQVFVLHNQLVQLSRQPRYRTGVPGAFNRLAAAQSDYIEAFSRTMPSIEAERMLFSCNCILNYLYADLEGKKTGEIVGPITFGEIAYMLLNQTLVYATVEDLPLAAE